MGSQNKSSACQVHNWNIAPSFRPLRRRWWNIAVLVIVNGIFVAPSHAEPIVLDTTIGAGSSFNGQNITIADGVDGPTTVELIDGGSVKGFTVTENSKLIIDGGTSTFLSGVSDNAQLIFRSGTLGCSDFELCAVIDPVAVLFASGTSQLHFFGGEIDGPLQLRDMSAAHFYGRELVIIESGGGQRVIGQYVNGDDISVFVNPILDIGPQILLHEVPEPGTLVISVAGMLLTILLVRTRGGMR